MFNNNNNIYYKKTPFTHKTFNTQYNYIMDILIHDPWIYR